MKTRTGFVSNSSSTAFILNPDAQGVYRYLQIAKEFIHGDITDGRASCIAYFQDLKKYLDYCDVWDFDYRRDYIKQYLEVFGEDTIMVRISDEGMGGSPPYPHGDLIWAEQDWH